MSETDSIVAGPKWDALMAEEVMEWVRVQQDLGEEWQNKEGRHVYGVESYHIRQVRGFHPSIYWSAAAEVLEKLYRDGPYKTGWSPCLARQNDGQWVCTLHNHADDGIPTGVAATAPLAICMAALAAVRSTATPCDTKEPAKCRHPNG